MENGAGELRKDMLEEVADKLTALERVAKMAADVVMRVPRKGKGSVESKVKRSEVNTLIVTLNAAGRYGGNGSFIKEVR
jgi:hypothetical protein